MLLTALRLQNFRCFTDLELTFHPRLTVLVGINGSGKSSVLDALAPGVEVVCKGAAKVFHNVPYNDIFKISDRSLKASSEKNAFIELSFAYQDTTHTFPFTFQEQADNSLLPDRGFVLYNFIQSNPTPPTEPTPLFAYYTAKRVVRNDQLNKQQAQSSLASAFANCADVAIDLAASLAWFDEKDAEQARIRSRKDPGFVIPEFEAVRQAIEGVLDNFIDPHMEGTPAELVLYKKGDPANTPYRLAQLSDGNRTMLALAMDLARRMAVANAAVCTARGLSPLASPAVVFIDEVELHLHPGWQQKVLPSLLALFPNAQFVVTTHSPQVLTSVPSECIRLLVDGTVQAAPPGSMGAEASRLLKRVFAVEPRPVNEVSEALNAYADKVYADQWDTDEARALRNKLDAAFGGEEPLLVELDLWIANRKWELGQ